MPDRRLSNSDRIGRSLSRELSQSRRGAKKLRSDLSLSLPRSFSLQHPVERGDQQKERQEIRKRVSQALDVEGANGDRCECDQCGDLRIRRKRQANRELSG